MRARATTNDTRRERTRRSGSDTAAPDTRDGACRPARVPLVALLGGAQRRLGLLAATAVLALAALGAGATAAWGQDAPAAAQAAQSPSEVAQGSLLYRDAAGRYQVLPLERTEVEIDVRGVVASVAVTQRFTNPTDAPLEALYVFPLPHDAAVYDMQARIGERVVRAVVKEREEARRTYEAARDEGRRAALVEQERPNVFSSSLANVLPGERIEVRLRYAGPLLWEDGRVRLTFPLVVGPRYVPAAASPSDEAAGAALDAPLPPSARGTEAQWQGTRAGHDVRIGVRLEAGLELRSFHSPSHELRSRREADGSTRIELASEAVLPNRDFVLEYRLAPPRGPRAALYVSSVADDEAPGDTGGRPFLLAAFPPQADAAAPRTPLELVFLVDVSGSMAGTSMEQARAALLQALERLTPDDRLHVVAYNHAFFAFQPEPLPATADLLARARRFVAGLVADGGTEMLPALQSVLALPPTPGYLRHVVLLTDGCLGNEEQIFAALKAGLGEARLFTVAIGSAPNHYLAANMAQFGRGSFTAISDVTEIRAQMGRLLDQISSPVLTDLRLTWHGVSAADVLPARLPDLFRGQPLLIHGRLHGDAPGRLVIEGRAGASAFRQELAVEPQRARFHPGITTLWARAKVDELMDLWRQAPEGPEQDARRADVVALAVQHHLVTRFTSLVAVEDVPAHTGGAPRTALVPAELPAGWQAEAVVGRNPQGGTADLFLESLGFALLITSAALLALRPRPA